jgi:hypothetical protein
MVSEWAEIFGKVLKRKTQKFARANNHYAGYGPATVGMFQVQSHRQMKEQTGWAEPLKKGMTLFRCELLVLLFGPLPTDRNQR